MKKSFPIITVSTFVHEVVWDLEEARHDCAQLDPILNRKEYLEAYANLSRHRKLLYTYLSGLEHYAAGHSAVVQVHLEDSTQLRF